MEGGGKEMHARKQKLELNYLKKEKVTLWPRNIDAYFYRIFF